MVMIDSLNGYRNGMPSERSLPIHMHEVRAYLAHRGVATLLTVTQHGMTGAPMRTPIDVSFLADTVILPRFFEAAGAVRQAISVVKKRRGAHERTLREMKIDSTGVCIGELLRNFQGVLMEVPRFRGNEARLLSHVDGEWMFRRDPTARRVLILAPVGGDAGLPAGGADRGERGSATVCAFGKARPARAGAEYRNL